MLIENKLSHQPGSVWGNTALIAGTTVGAGILALPAVTLPSGVVPSTVLLIAVWLYTVISGLLLAEVCVNAMRLEGRLSVGLLAMVERTLGFVGARIAGAAYLFLHYALLVAYMTEGGNILVSGVSQVWGLQNIPPAWVGTIAFTLLFGGIMYLGREKFLEKLNSTFVAIVITSFLGLLLLGGGQVKTVQLLTHNWTALGSAVSVMLVALFFHNIVPVVVTQLEGDIPKIRQSIIIGSLIPLMMFLLWNAVILGSISPDIQSTGNFDPLQILRAGGAGEWLGILLSIFSEFAIATSFIGFVYGLLDFFQDMFPVVRGKPSSRLPIYSLILLPPMSLGAINPSIFFSALDFAGTFSISVLGGIIPALMTWKQRQEPQLNSINQPLVPGGRVTLIIMMAIASVLIIKQILAMSGHK
ncbi:aromatic amino acid transport family protein [Nodularia spumigena CS-584]|uniref:Aromatic amino acid transport family protein n=1 Tax=Nodularia spumigena UHCC 0060 TaxID=3110300 RepID=A0ABU5UMJ2_NODSP|nr:aromatic amino acid transport family protein [Nodularia spumigena]AHJ29804.1 putative tyrosine/tryptophan transport protein [Nodularia spumigena CCY9414]EAW42803.1 Tyrosine Transport protein [Nodularia spumigena CCY9414]MDB9381363.1 aromatic amino acid transport family protein [Nodularia spumigena CS-584]MEA5525911.1 aromatic amino acid transport family protein [Nodularia spumigena UHCC 0143]MEA5607483.1 aromatic amino acid transport family protein [Nodularia spumigena UHCC 0060]